MEKYRKFVFDYFNRIIRDESVSKTISLIPRMEKFALSENIQEAGHRNNFICLVASGMVRGFYIDEEGNDITKCFSMEGDWCCSYNYLSALPCPFFLEAEEETILAKFDIHEIDRMKSVYPIIAEKSGKIIAQSMMESERRIYSFTSKEAKDRYELLLKEQPELIKRARQEYIASYLGVTPSSLSRIKRFL